ncbi:hypothetical protein HDU67_004773 [Dinochytrium kinnereticum]|nr:hypothetical protein HDU67_004773 [Dinochytrium kinnereticum]
MAVGNGEKSGDQIVLKTDEGSNGGRSILQSPSMSGSHSTQEQETARVPDTLSAETSWFSFLASLKLLDTFPDALFPLLPLLLTPSTPLTTSTSTQTLLLFLPLTSISLALPIYSHLLTPQATDLYTALLIPLFLLTLYASFLLPTSLRSKWFRRAVKAWWVFAIVCVGGAVGILSPRFTVAVGVVRETVRVVPRVPANCFGPRLSVMRFEQLEDNGVGQMVGVLKLRRVAPGVNVFEMDAGEFEGREVDDFSHSNAFARCQDPSITTPPNIISLCISLGSVLQLHEESHRGLSPTSLVLSKR